MTIYQIPLTNIQYLAFQKQFALVCIVAKAIGIYLVKSDPKQSQGVIVLVGHKTNKGGNKGVKNGSIVPNLIYFRILELRDFLPFKKKANSDFILLPHLFR